jgi:hypothetical protein
MALLKRRGLLAAAAIVATLGVCHASEAPPAAYIPLRTDCTAAEAVPLDWRTFIKSPDRYAGRCVRARGLIAFRNFYAGVPELYRASGISQFRTSAAAAVYGSPAVEDALWGARSIAELVGYTYTCGQLDSHHELEAAKETALARARGEEVEYVTLVTGNCHYRSGAVLLVSEWHLMPHEPARLTTPTAARTYGNIGEMPPDWPHAKEVMRILGSRFTALRERNMPQLLRTMREQAGYADSTDADEYMTRFAALSTTARPAIRYFVSQPETGDRWTRYVAYGCVCVVESCTGKWPISSVDIDDWRGEERPFQCMRVSRDTALHVN